MKALQSLERLLDGVIRIVEWLLKNIIPIGILIGCSYLIYRVYKWRKQKLKAKEKEEPYYKKFYTGGKNAR